MEAREIPATVELVLCHGLIPGIRRRFVKRQPAKTLDQFWRKINIEQQSAPSLASLRNKLLSTRKDVEHYLDRGWLSLCELLNRYDWKMDELLELWAQAQSYLLQLRRILSFLILWATLFLLLQYSQVSEFPGRIRPPCTTMPWTIWPALVVLWGVCWMFYGTSDADWEQLFDFPVASHGPGVLPTFDDELGLLTNFDFTTSESALPSDFDERSYNTSGWAAYDSDPFGSRQYVQPQTVPYAHSMISQTPMPGIMSSQADIPVNASFTQFGVLNGISAGPASAQHQVTSAYQASPQVDVTTSAAVTSDLFFPYTEPQSIRTAPSANTKHGQAEKYFCTYVDCPRSKTGSGFLRKDHLDQHLRGRHKQTSVPRMRAKAAVRSNAKPTAIDEDASTSLPSRKRSRESRSGSVSEAETDDRTKLLKEIAEERRLRQAAEEEVGRLRQRLEKSEDRVDGLMTLLEKKQKE